MNNLTPTELADLERRIAAALPEYGDVLTPSWTNSTVDPSFVEAAYHRILGRAVEACWRVCIFPRFEGDEREHLRCVTLDDGDGGEWQGNASDPLAALVSALEQRAAAKGGGR